MTAAETIAAFAVTLTSTRSRRRWSSTRSSTCSTRSAAGSPRTRAASAIEGRATMAGARRRGAGDRDRARPSGSRRRTPRSRTRCSATGSTSTTRTPTRSSHVSTVDRAGGARRRGALRRGRERRARGDRRRQRGRLPDRHGGPGAFHARGFHPTAICGVFGATAAVAPPRRLRRRDDNERARDRRLDGVGDLRVPRRRDADEADPPGWAAHGAHIATRLAHARRGRAAGGIRARNSAIYHAFLGIEPGTSGLDEQLADLGSRWETPRIAYKPFPVCHFTHGALGAAVDAVEGARSHRTRSTRSSSAFPQPCGADRARAGRREEGAAVRVRGRSSRSSTPSPRCSCAATWA